MRSLLDLNTFGQTPFDVTDNRTARAILDFSYPLSPQDDQIDISSTNVSISSVANIKQVVNYQTANVRYQVKIITGTATPLLGSTISWDSLPSGVSLSQTGDTYLLTGIKSLSNWNAVKDFHWNLPSNYSSCPLWYLEVSILYYDEFLDAEQTITWNVYDNRFYFVGTLESSFSSSITATKAKLVSAELTEYSSALVAAGYQYKGIIETLPVIATLTATGRVNPVTFEMFTELDATANASFIGSASLSSNATINSTAYVFLKNVISRNYTGNNKNFIFSSNPMYINEDDNSGATYNIVLSCLNGKWGLDGLTVLDEINYSGTKNQINDLIPTIEFYPNLNYSSNTTFNCKIYKNSVLVFEKNISLLGTAGTYSGARYVAYETAGTFTFTPYVIDQMYGKIGGLILLGGGGGGSPAGQGYAGGGGGGAGYNTYKNINITENSYSIIVGDGGGPAQNGGVTYFGSLNGAPNGSTSELGLPLIAGHAGGIYSEGSFVAYGGGGGSGVFSGLYYGGGGGGGNAGPGSNGSVSAGTYYFGGAGGFGNTPYAYDTSAETFSYTNSYGGGGGGAACGNSASNTHAASGNSGGGHGYSPYTTYQLDAQAFGSGGGGGGGRGKNGFIRFWIVSK